MKPYIICLQVTLLLICAAMRMVGIWNLLHWDYAFWWFLKNTWRCRVKVLIKTLCPTSGAGQEGIHSVLLSYSLFNWTGDVNVSIISAAAWGWESGHFGGHKCLCRTTERRHRGLHTWATVTNRFVVTVYRLYKVKGVFANPYYTQVEKGVNELLLRKAIQVLFYMPTILAFLHYPSHT